jgi:hypothetical protein
LIRIRIDSTEYLSDPGRGAFSGIFINRVTNIENCTLLQKGHLRPEGGARTPGSAHGALWADRFIPILSSFWDTLKYILVEHASGLDRPTGTWSKDGSTVH